MSGDLSLAGWNLEPATTRSGKPLSSVVLPSLTPVKEKSREEAKKKTEEEKKEAKKKEEVEEEGEKESKKTEDIKDPIFLTRWIADRPRLFFGLFLGAHLFFMVLSGVLYLSGYDIIPDDWDAVPMEVKDEPWLKREYAWQDRDEFANRILRDLPPDKFPTWDRAFTEEKVLLFYNAGNDNIFAKEKLQAMREIEQRLFDIPKFTDYCQVDNDGACVPFESVLRFFDGTYSPVDPVFNDPDFDNIDAVLYAASIHNETKGAFIYALGKKNKVTSTSVTSTLTRTLVPLGWPLNDHDEDEDMLEKVMDYMADEMEPILRDSEDLSAFEFTYYNYWLMFRVGKRQAMIDMGLAAAAMIFIFSFMWFHTRSLMVTALAVMSIICSYVETNFVYRVIIDFRYFGYFHLLAMFIILGIGADDIFVFWDAWRATGLKQYPSLSHRINAAYRRSAVTMLVTSLTTAGAFLANTLSPLLATSSFGVFSAVLVMVNYISVVTFFPSVIVFYHLNYEDKPHPCCCCWKKEKKDNDDDAEQARNGSNDQPVSTISHTEGNGFVSTNGQVRTNGSINKLQENDPSYGTNHSSNSFRSTTADEDSQPKKPNKLVIFFRDYYFKAVTHRVLRWVIILALLGCVGVFVYYAVQLEPDNEEMKFFRDYIAYSKAMEHNNYGFVPNDQDETVRVQLVWGLKENDLSGCHFSSKECKGEHGFDGSFDASTIAAQQSLVSLCDTLFTFTEQQISDLAIRQDVITGRPEIACFPRNMETFFKNDAVSDAVNVTMPWGQPQTVAFMMKLSQYFDTSVLKSPPFDRYLDIPITYWIWDAFNQNYTSDYQTFNNLIGEVNDTFTTGILTNPSITTGNRIQYLAIAINTTLNMRSLGHEEGIPIRDRWEAFMEEQLERMPAEMQSGFQFTEFSWHWLQVQKVVSDNAIQGMALGLSLSFPVLVLATGNIIIGLLASMSIGCVTACVIGVIPLAGWKLGVLVSFNMCLLVGLAVDFVVHLAEGYHESPRPDRKGKVQDALERMGTSVFAGACTTIGASFFMLFAKIQFFFQFGIFMISAIGFSFVFSMGLFIPVMAIVGPEGDTGDLRVLFRKCCALCRPKKKGDNPPLPSSSRPASSPQNVFNQV